MGGRKILHQVSPSGTPYGRISAAAMAVYGGVCEWCGDGESPLQFDHTYGGGDDHRRKENANSLKRRIAAAGKRLTDVHLQLLCERCHRSKNGIEGVMRRLTERGVYLNMPTRPVSRAQIRSDAAQIVASVLA